jgi:hypothetical protein
MNNRHVGGRSSETWAHSIDMIIIIIIAGGNLQIVTTELYVTNLNFEFISVFTDRPVFFVPVLRQLEDYITQESVQLEMSDNIDRIRTVDRHPRVTCVSRLGGVVVRVLATGPKGRGFKLGRRDGFLKAIKSAKHLPSDGM